ncbi:MAG: hypothetical protein IKZ48_00880 [Prevotella sp.]|nr:hypothetical protein [Prevotella sp.]
MKKEYTPPQTEQLTFIINKSFLLTASPGGHTDEALSRTDRYDDEDSPQTRYNKPDLWEDEEEEEEDEWSNDF